MLWQRHDDLSDDSLCSSLRGSRRGAQVAGGCSSIHNSPAVAFMQPQAPQVLMSRRRGRIRDEGLLNCDILATPGQPE